MSNDKGGWIFSSQIAISLIGIVGAFQTTHAALAVVITILSMVIFMNAILLLTD